MTRAFLVVLAVLALVSASACGGEDPVPASPNWVDDVEPILRGNCFHCHGAGPRPDADAGRWDIFDSTTQDRFGALASGLDPVAKARRVVIYGRASANMPPMPPLPATRLSARDLDVLKNWSELETAQRGKRTPNSLPTAAWLTKGVSYLVTDGDHEQVLGKLTCGADEEHIRHSGAHKLPSNFKPPCIVDLHDGQDATRARLE